jgi:hypothetical protein
MLIDKLKLINKKKNFAKNHSLKHLKDEQPVFAFFASCLERYEVTVPIFEKLFDHSLIVS